MTPRDDIPETHMEEIRGNEVRELRLALATRQTELRLVTEDRDDLRRNARRLNAALDDAEAQVAEQSLDLVRLADLVCNHEIALDKFRVRTGELERSLQDMTARERRAATAEREAMRWASGLEATLAESRSRSGQLLALLASVAGNMAQQQTQLQSVHLSIWWKAGAPVRWISRMAGIRDPRERDRRARVLELNASPWFDGDWYLRNNPDACLQQLDPADHYLSHGAAESRNPGPDFDTLFYMESNLDVAASGLNPLIHFIRHGEAEGRLPHGRQ